MIQASVLLITKNEERSLPKTLASLKEFSEILVVDGESGDRTREIAHQFGARVFRRPFDHFANQRNFALERASRDWILWIDADEVANPELLGAIREVVAQKKGSPSGYRIHIRTSHFGRELRWGDQGQFRPVRFFRKQKGHFAGSIHEFVQVEGEIGSLPGALLHESNPTVKDYLEKLRLYTSLEAKTWKESGRSISFWHWGCKPFLRFLYVYFLRFGFLDGFEGFLFHALSSFYSVLKQARANELSQEEPSLCKI